MADSRRPTHERAAREGASAERAIRRSSQSRSGRGKTGGPTGMRKFRWTRGGFVLVVSGVLAAILLIYGLRQINQPHDVDLSTLIADVKADVAVHKIDTLTL